MSPGTVFDPTCSPLTASGRPSTSPVYPFLIGTAVGGVAGAVVGTLLSEHMTHLVAAVIGIVNRRLTAAERDELRFELLLQ